MEKVERPVLERRKIALFTNVEERAVISGVDADDIYKIPMLLHEQGLDDIVVDKLRLNVPPADLTEWKILLDNLAVETRILEPEQERPVIMAELADAYWQIDKNQSKKLFTDAFDHALSLPTARKPSDVTANVLSIVARRDRALAVSLTKRLVEFRDKGSPSGEQALQVAGDLLESQKCFERLWCVLSELLVQDVCKLKSHKDSREAAD